uniref:Uncharacterized protein n=1 Tax=Cafeteria roenbergensis TaxID=33653 RepID=A0A7S0P974_CAFRO
MALPWSLQERACCTWTAQVRKAAPHHDALRGNQCGRRPPGTMGMPAASSAGWARKLETLSAAWLQPVRAVQPRPGSSDSVFNMEWSPRGQVCVCALSSGEAVVLDGRSLRTVAVLEGHTQGCNVARFRGDATVFTGSDDRTAREWDLRSVAPTSLRGAAAGAAAEAIARGTEGASLAAAHAAVSGAGPSLPPVGGARTSRGPCVRVYRGHSELGWVKNCEPLCGGLLLTSAFDGTVRLWDTAASAASPYIPTDGPWTWADPETCLLRGFAVPLTGNVVFAHPDLRRIAVHPDWAGGGRDAKLALSVGSSTLLVHRMRPRSLAADLDAAWAGVPAAGEHTYDTPLGLHSLMYLARVVSPQLFTRGTAFAVAAWEAQGVDERGVSGAWRQLEEVEPGSVAWATDPVATAEAAVAAASPERRALAQAADAADLASRQPEGPGAPLCPTPLARPPAASAAPPSSPASAASDSVPSSRSAAPAATPAAAAQRPAAAPATPPPPPAAAAAALPLGACNIVERVDAGDGGAALSLRFSGDGRGLVLSRTAEQHDGRTVWSLPPQLGTDECHIVDTTVEDDDTAAAAAAATAAAPPSTHLASGALPRASAAPTATASAESPEAAAASAPASTALPGAAPAARPPAGFARIGPRWRLALPSPSVLRRVQADSAEGEAEGEADSQARRLAAVLRVLDQSGGSSLASWAGPLAEHAVRLVGAQAAADSGPRPRAAATRGASAGNALAPEAEGECAADGRLAGCLAMPHVFLEVAHTLRAWKSMPFMPAITAFWRRTCPALAELFEASTADVGPGLSGGDPATTLSHRLVSCWQSSDDAFCPSPEAAASGSATSGSWAGALRILGRALCKPLDRVRPALPVRLSQAVMCRMVMSSSAQGIIKGPHLDASGRWAALPNGYGAIVLDVDQLRVQWRRNGCSRPLSNAARAVPPAHAEPRPRALSVDLLGLPPAPRAQPARQPASSQAAQSTKRPTWTACRAGVAELCSPIPDLPSAAEPVVGLAPPWVSCDFARFRVQNGRIQDRIVAALVPASVPGEDFLSAGGVLTVRFQPAARGVARLCLCRGDGSVTVCEPRSASFADP